MWILEGAHVLWVCCGPGRGGGVWVGPWPVSWYVHRCKLATAWLGDWVQLNSSGVSSNKQVHNTVQASSQP